jgi:hypothetical protein
MLSIYFLPLVKKRVKTDLTLKNVESLSHQHFNDKTTELPAEKNCLENADPSVADYAGKFD